MLAAAVVAMTAPGYRRLSRHPIPDRDFIPHSGPLVHDDAAELMAQHYRRTDGIVDGVVVQVKVGATYTGSFDLDLNLTVRGLPLVNIEIIDESVAPGVFDDSLHGSATSESVIQLSRNACVETFRWRQALPPNTLVFGGDPHKTENR
jgi:hypothetical protein